MPAGTNKLVLGEVLQQEEFLQSNNGHYRLYYQDDGDFTLYDATVNNPGNHRGRPLWDSQTFNHKPAYAALLQDGNLVLYDSAVLVNPGDGGQDIVWETGTNTPNQRGTHLILHDDGTAVLYGMTPVYTISAAGTKKQDPPPAAQGVNILKVIESTGADIVNVVQTVANDVKAVANVVSVLSSIF
jgi:hypothetical protein